MISYGVTNVKLFYCLRGSYKLILLKFPTKYDFFIETWDTWYIKS
ncbi:unnamed protein product [Tenebrio molitor]|nr:unnamed protein product [Tenebrio molitor]